MRINKPTFGFMLLVVFVLHATASDNSGLETLNEGFPILTDLTEKLLASSPAAPFLIAGLSLLHVLTTMLLGGGDDPNKLTKLDLQETQKAIMERLESVDAHIDESTDKIIRELTHTIKSYPFFESLRNQLESFKRDYSANMPVILDPKWSKMKRNSIKSMMQYDSGFRKGLGGFITTYIKPTVMMPTSEPTDLFFDFLKQKDNLLALENKDCNQDSLHYKIYKSFIYIAKGLTDSYVMALSAHVAQYQEEIRQDNTNDAYGTKKAAETLIEEFKNAIKELMSKTKWALENSSREIKNCGAFELTKETFARLPLVTTVAQLKVQSSYFCIVDDRVPASLTNFSLVNTTNVEGAIPVRTGFEVYYNAKDLERPFSHVKYGSTTLGHADGVSSSLLSKYVSNPYCASEFYLGYKENGVGISMQRVRANPGNVITGVRWRLRKNVIYIDIQQAIWINDLEVDSRTVVWKETPEDRNQVVYLSSSLDKIEIGDHILDDGDYLTAVQLQQTYRRNGVIKLFFEGSKSPSWCSNGSKATFEPISDTNEIKLDERDDPQKASANVNRIISMPPNRKQPAYVKFQVSSFKKDLGRTTIPYIDTREVFTNPPSPVAGIGIYHEAAKGDGGLLALKLFSPSLSKSIDYSQFEDFARPEVVAENILHS